MGLVTDSGLGVLATILYIIVYAVMICIFLLVLLLCRVTGKRELIYLSDFRTLSQDNPALAAALVLCVFSMAGIPPLVGFYVKYLVLQNVLLTGLVGQVAGSLALSLVSAYYYLQVIS